MINLNTKEISTFIEELNYPIYIFDLWNNLTNNKELKENDIDNNFPFLYDVYLDKNLYYSHYKISVNEPKDIIIEEFIKIFGDNGDVIVSDIDLKKEALNNLAVIFPSHHDQINAISARLKDLVLPLKSQKLYNSRMTDTNYLKRVINLLCPYVNYKKLKISSETEKNKNTWYLVQVLKQLSLYSIDGVDSNIYLEMIRYISIHGKLVVSFHPVPIPDVDVSFNFDKEFGELKSLLGSFWFDSFYDNYVINFTSGGGPFTFSLTENGDFNVSFEGIRDYSWEETYKYKFQEALKDYGLLRFLNKFYSNNYIQNLIENEYIDENDNNQCIDAINDIIDVTFEYDSNKGLNKFELRIGHYDDGKRLLISRFSKQSIVIESLAKRVIIEITNELMFCKNDMVEINCSDENSIGVRYYTGPYNFTLSKPKSLVISE